MEPQKQTKKDFKTGLTLLAENRKAIIFETVKLLLILLWSYTTTSKLIDISEFKRELHNQNFSRSFADFLFWFIPLSEITAAITLIFYKSRWLGLLLSNSLMLLFTGYIALVLLGYYSSVPCSCGGVFKHIGWQMHFWFNLCFLLLSLWATHYYYQLSNLSNCE